MRINFAWIASNETYDANIHNREDEKIFHLEIKHKEAGFARARIKVVNPRCGLLWPTDKQYCFISFDNKLIFKGCLQGMPSDYDGELVTLNFTAAIDDIDLKRSKLCHEIKENGVYDPLFFNDKNPSLSQLLQAYTALPYWNRINGDLVLSDIFKGRKTLNIADHFFRDSLCVSVTGQPLSKVEVDINAEWLQQAKGTLEIGKHIKKQLPGGYLSTLTNKCLEEAWWHKYAHIKQNGYHIEESKLKKIHPVNTEDFPNTSRSFWHYDEHPRKVQFERNWYDVHLRLGWSYRQKRRERAIFLLEQSIQKISGQSDRVKNLTFKLPSILGKNYHWQPQHYYTEGFQVIYDGAVYRCLRNHKSKENFEPKKWLQQNNLAHIDGQSARSEFFTTDRGKNVISYAIEVAKAHLAASARCINFRFSLCLSLCSDITLDHTVTIQDPRLPGGCVQGKVVQYRFLVDGKTGERVADVIIAVSIGNGISTTSAFNEEEGYFHSDVLENDVVKSASAIERSRSLICYEISPDSSPVLGITRPYLLNEENIIEELEILNDAQFQERHLSQKQYPHNMNIKRVLKNIPTNIRLKLKDLKTQGCLERTIPIKILTKWSAPQHIDLSAPKE